jgi:hypothetical protein
MTTVPLAVGTRKIAVAAVLVAVALALLVVPSGASAAAGSSQLLREGIGMRHAPSVRVQALQHALVRRGYSVGHYGADGRFGPRTERAVRRFQRAQHVRVDGIVGPQTRTALRRTADAVSRGAAPTRHAATRTNTPAADHGHTRTPATAPVASPPHARPAPQPAPLDLGSGPAWWHQPLLLGLLAAFGVVFAAVAWPRWRARTSVYKYARAQPARGRPESEPPPVAAAEWASEARAG